MIMLVSVFTYVYVLSLALSYGYICIAIIFLRFVGYLSRFYSQNFNNLISTHLFTVLTKSVIVRIEQEKQVILLLYEEVLP